MLRREYKLYKSVENRNALTVLYNREDVRGLNRLHQFGKVEIVRIDKPEHSYDSLDESVKAQKTCSCSSRRRAARLLSSILGFSMFCKIEFKFSVPHSLFFCMHNT